MILKSNVQNLVSSCLSLNFAGDFMGFISSIQTRDLVEKMERLTVLVIGDIMLDRYLYGNVSRISPEAPVPVVQVEGREDRLGGASNVAMNCKALGATVHLAGVVGTDRAGEDCLRLLDENQIDHSLILKDEYRPTTIKTRVISRQQQLFRLDEETAGPLVLSLEHQFIDALLRHIQIQKPDIVIFEDYDKGTLNDNIIDKVMKHCIHLGCVVSVDPKLRHFHVYKNATIFKPNIKEVKDAFNLEYRKNILELIDDGARLIKERLDPQVILITLSELGIYVEEGKDKAIIPGKKRNIADVSGAGDTVISVASLVYAVSKDGNLSAQLANIAGGMVCEYPGVVTISKQDWIREIDLVLKKENH